MLMAATWTCQNALAQDIPHLHRAATAADADGDDGVVAVYLNDILHNACSSEASHSETCAPYFIQQLCQ